MTPDQILRASVIAFSAALGAGLIAVIWYWHVRNNEFSVMENFTAIGRDGKQHPSRPALGEMVALFATTSGYLSTLALKPDLFPESTMIYGGIWAVRGGFSTYLRSKKP